MEKRELARSIRGRKISLLPFLHNLKLVKRLAEVMEWNKMFLKLTWAQKLRFFSNIMLVEIFTICPEDSKSYFQRNGMQINGFYSTHFARVSLKWNVLHLDAWARGGG